MSTLEVAGVHPGDGRRPDVSALDAARTLALSCAPIHLGRAEAPGASAQAGTTTGCRDGSMNTVNWGSIGIRDLVLIALTDCNDTGSQVQAHSGLIVTGNLNLAAGAVFSVASNHFTSVGGVTDMGAGTTECATPGNVQINATPPEPDYVYPWDDEFYGSALIMGGGGYGAHGYGAHGGR